MLYFCAMEENFCFSDDNFIHRFCDDDDHDYLLLITDRENLQQS